MRVGGGRADFDYGNSRLRARKASLLDRSDYSALLGKDLEGLISGLSETPYGPELEQASGRLTGLSALHEAVARHLGRSLEEMRGFYRNSARRLVELLLSRWDLQNLLTLLRGRVAGLPSEEILAGIAPIGGLDEVAAGGVAGHSDTGRAVELLVSWRLPDPGLARALARAWPAYVRSEDLAALEQALAAEHFARSSNAIDELGDEAEPLARDVERTADLINVLAALRLRRGRDDRAPGVGTEVHARSFVVGGSVPRARLSDAVDMATDADAAAGLAEAVHEPRFREALTAWSPEHGLVALQGELEARRVRGALELFRSGDPLSVAVPVAYTAAKETEARNIRLLGYGAARGLDRDELGARLVLPQEGPS